LQQRATIEEAMSFCCFHVQHMHLCIHVLLLGTVVLCMQLLHKYAGGAGCCAPNCTACWVNRIVSMKRMALLPCCLQVLEQLQLLQDQVALTYSEARAAAKGQQQLQQQQWPDCAALNASDNNTAQLTQSLPGCSSSSISSACYQPGLGSSSAGVAGGQTSSSGSGSSSSTDDKGNDMLSAFVAELRGAAGDEGAAAAAAAALSEMREWVAQQDMRMVEVRQLSTRVH
jgi:uncharacterized membrane protein YgcG